MCNDVGGKNDCTAVALYVQPAAVTQQGRAADACMHSCDGSGHFEYKMHYGLVFARAVGFLVNVSLKVWR